MEDLILYDISEEVTTEVEKEILYEKALGTYDTREVTKAAMQAGEYIIGDVKIHGTERERKNGNH